MLLEEANMFLHIRKGPYIGKEATPPSYEEEALTTLFYVSLFFPLSNSRCWTSYSLGCVILKYIFVSQQGGKGGPGVTAVYKLPRYWTQFHLKQQGSEPQGYSKKVG